MNSVNVTDWLGALTGLFALSFMIMTASLGLIWKSARAWGRSEDRQATMLEQMTYDRNATDKRLRYLEEWLMSQKR